MKSLPGLKTAAERPGHRGEARPPRRSSEGLRAADCDSFDVIALDFSIIWCILGTLSVLSLVCDSIVVVGSSCHYRRVRLTSLTLQNPTIDSTVILTLATFPSCFPNSRYLQITIHQTCNKLRPFLTVSRNLPSTPHPPTRMIDRRKGGIPKIIMGDHSKISAHLPSRNASRPHHPTAPLRLGFVFLIHFSSASPACTLDPDLR